MIKKIAFILIAMLAMGVVVNACSSSDLDHFLSTGSLGAKVNQTENQGWMMTSAEWVDINYFVAPTPPYQTATINVAFTGPCSTDENGMTICGKALRLISAEVWVMKNGQCKVKNIN